MVEGRVRTVAILGEHLNGKKFKKMLFTPSVNQSVCSCNIESLWSLNVFIFSVLSVINKKAPN